MGRPFDKHIDNLELSALVSDSSESEHELPGPPSDAVRQAELHVRSCADCSAKVSKYRRLVDRSPNGVRPTAVPRGVDCPNGDDVDWHKVAGGQWPELKATRLIMHAALCDHCGPLLRTAVSVRDDSTPQEEQSFVNLKAPSRVGSVFPEKRPLPPFWSLARWVVPVLALMLIVIVLGKQPSLSGPKFAEFAVSTHRQYARGNLLLDVRSDSQQMLNEWFKTKLKFPLALPAASALPGEQRPYRLEGARLVPVGGTTSAYIAYRMQNGAASLIVTPDSVAVATGGVEANFKKVSFHYAMVEGYKIVTWSAHGLTYALVSEEGNDTQRSCMVCHSAMRDRDLSHTPTPLQGHGYALKPILQ